MFGCAVLEIWLPPARWMLWWSQSAKPPHSTRVSFRIRILYRFAHNCRYSKWKNGWGGLNVWRPWQRDRNCTGMRESAGVGIAQAQGTTLHNRKVRRCTGYVTVIPIKQRVLLRLGVARANARGGARGNACGVCTATAMQCVPWNFQTLPCLPLVISSTFPATHGMRDSRSRAIFHCANCTDDDRRCRA